MNVRELMEVLSKADPEMEVVVEDHSSEYFSGIEYRGTGVREVAPSQEDEGAGCWGPLEGALVLAQTHESVARDTPGDD